MFLSALAQPAASPDVRLLFLVNLVTVAAVLLFAAGLVFVLLRRSYERRAEEQKLAAMGTATARILHQIKNPLQTILLHADLLQNERIAGDRETRGEVCQAIVGEAQRLTAMLAELSTYASGASRALALEPFPLHELVRELAAQERREGQMEVVLERCDAATVRADVYYLRQALENLIANAREAMHDAPVRRLALSLERRGAIAEVSVADTGPGIAPERLATLFEPFLSAKSRGMGLGLTICKEIVEGHGGRIEVESVPGAGTRFRIHLPLLPASDPVPAAAAGVPA